MAAQGCTCEPDGPAGPFWRSSLAIQSLPNLRARVGRHSPHQGGARGAAARSPSCARQSASLRVRAQ
eukprot:4660038-Amphidinium_carterae.1